MSWLSSVFTDSTTPAWVQAVGSVLAILIAVAVPWRQRHNAQRDAAAERERQTRERLERLVAGLKAEVNAAVEAATRHRTTAERTLSNAASAQRAGQAVVDRSPFPPGSIVLTDAIVYRAIASELGHFPSRIVQHIVMFYTSMLDVARLAEMATTASGSFGLLRDLAPRAQMNGTILIELLDRFRQAGFDPNADIRLDPKRAREIAQQFGYPLDEVLAMRGLNLD